MKRDDRQFFVKNFRNFIQFDRKKLLVIFVLTILFAFTQGAGYLMIIPLLKLLDFDSGSGSGAFEKFFAEGLNRLHFEPTLELILFLYLLIVSVLFLLQNKKSVIQSSFQHAFSGLLRKDFYKQILYSRWQDLTRISKVRHMQALTSEIPKATHFFFYMLQAITKVIIILIHVILAFMVSWKLSVIIFVIGFLQFWLLAPFFKKSYEYGRTGRKTFRRVLKNIDDFWMTIKPAKIHRSEDFYFNNFSKADDVFSTNQIAQYKHNQRPQLLYRFLGLINLVILILTANYFFPVSVPSLIVLVLLFGRILPLFINTFQDVNLMYFNAESLRSLQQLELNACDTEQKSDSLQTVSLTSGISIENLDFSYSNNTTVFRNFNASVPSKKITGITGESGSGKTTMVDLICGLLTPDNGRVLLDDVDIQNNNNLSFGHLISYLPQESLFIDGTLRENLIWDSACKQPDEIMNELLKNLNASDFLLKRDITLDTDIHHFKFSFSGGELQRIAIVRALLRNPKLLILDEATSALDVKNEDIIFNYLKKISSEITIIIVTHKSRLLKYCDHIITLPADR